MFRRSVAAQILNALVSQSFQDSCRASLSRLTPMVLLQLFPRMDGIASKGNLILDCCHHVEDPKYVSLGTCVFNSRRTGNLMFSLAALLFVSENTGRIPILPSYMLHGWIDEYFNTSSIKKIPNNFIYDANESIILTERYGPLAYDPIFKNPHANSSIRNIKILLICGYFQNYYYVRNVEKSLKTLFQFHSATKSNVSHFINHHKSLVNKSYQNIKTVGVHVRRTDFLTIDNQRQGLTVIDENYVNSTVHFFLNYLVAKGADFIIFFVACQDYAWVNSTIYKLNITQIFTNVRFVPSTNNNGPFDMCLISMCDGVITSTGSFSWWAGWLANTTTTYYTGYPKNGSEIAKYFDRRTYQKPDWIGFT
ncbi:hypothetical protein HELRODRAFT_173606 [Helobdella robusta]|uniref:L-Fucosyltransferase n=1 Tax=Helobdella robusta TaxID=6412 RepID=T1F712_HELRO|nr:hypothetical protein HELRODRAFT_173606 [Helobdella robusta]ESO03320.1 hypothetical protein HELRODRAFT_173606 [Helobdella robusta]